MGRSKAAEVKSSKVEALRFVAGASCQYPRAAGAFERIDVAALKCCIIEDDDEDLR